MPIVNEQTPTYDDYDLPKEVELLKAALDERELEVDPAFFGHVEKGDILEIYRFPEIKQIYCNSEFKKQSSYSDEQLKNMPFTQLYWRSDENHLALIKRTSYVMENETGAVPWNLPVHELVESLHPRKRTFEMKMRWIAPCFRKKTHEKVGFVTAHLALHIFEWDEDID